MIHYFFRVFSMTSHQQFKSIGEVFSMTFLHGRFQFHPSGEPDLTIKSLNVSKANTIWPKWSLRWSRRPWVKLEFRILRLVQQSDCFKSDSSIQLVFELFLKIILESKLFIFTYSNKIHCSWILLLNVKVKGQSKSSRDLKSMEVILRNFGIVKKMVLQWVRGF